ncbi:MAG TPA: biotin/lipoyl-binding protein, partial [Solirubrobacteraceae bacterium]|nr:biotin/lipoyl-binding protein [Solirubrobacteraceae bacterium]
MNIRVPWHVLGLVAVLAAVVVAAVIELGPPSQTTRTSTEVVTATKGVIQSTVTGTGNLEPGTDVEANFQTSGTLQHLYVKDGDHVSKGELIATLDPTAAQLTVQQAESNLTSAEDNLSNAEDQTATSGSSSSAASTSLENVQESTEFVAFHPAAVTTTQTTTTQTSTTPGRTTTTPTTTTPTTSTPTTSTPAASTPTASTPTRTTQGSGSSGSGSSAGSRSGGGSGGGSGGSSGGSGQTSTTSAETIAANIASAQASVDGAEATLRTAESALDETRLFAPAAGTVVNVESVSPGDAISGGGSGSSATASSSSDSGSGSTTGTGSTAGSLGGSAGSSSSSSSSSGLVEIVNTRAMTMTVAFSESDISKLKVGQPANVTLEALSGVELAAHISAISTLGTSSSGVVSYNATLSLDQRDSRVKAGMSASAAVITGQASGVNLPNSAITTAGSVGRVELLQNGTATPTTVVVGLVGDTRTQIVSGLKSGAQVQVTTTLPALGSGTSALGSGSTGTLGGGTGFGGGTARLLGGGGGF